MAAGATAILSGDEDLLALSLWRGVQIMRPGEFLDKFGVSGPRV